MRLRGWASLKNYSVTKTMGTPIQTGSASLHTSLSVAGTKDGKDVGLSKEANSMSTEETTSNIPVSAETTVVPTASTASTPSTPAVPPPQATLPTSTTTPVVPPPSATPKKSWASLLPPSTSSSSASA